MGIRCLKDGRIAVEASRNLIEGMVDVIIELPLAECSVSSCGFPGKQSGDGKSR
jgi:hypothetical protein